MKKITDREYKGFLEYQKTLKSGLVLLPNTIRFICEAYNYNPEAIGQHFLDMLPNLSK